MALNGNKKKQNPYYQKPKVNVKRNPIAREMDEILDDIDKAEKKKKKKRGLFNFKG